MTRKWMMMGVVLAFFTVLISGCASSGSDANSGSGKEADANNGGANNGPVELTIFSMSGDTPESFDERFGDDIRKRFPNYKITYIQRPKGSSISDVLASGTHIDMEWDSFGTFASSVIAAGQQYDMTELIKKHNVDLNRFEPSLIDGMRDMSNGGLYGLPVFNNRLGIFYNKDIFEKFGVPYPRDGMTWDELIDLALKLNRQEGGTNYIGFAGSMNHDILTNEFSLPLVDPETDKSTLGNEKWKQLYETVFMKPAQSPVYKDEIARLSGKLPGQDQFLKDKNLAMFGSLSTLFTVLGDDLSAMKWDIVSYPTFKELPGVGPQAYPTYFAITAQCTNKDAAMEVIKYLTSDEYQMQHAKQGTMPVLKNPEIQKALGQETKVKDKNFGAFFYNKFPDLAPRSKYESLVPVLGEYTKKIVPLIRGDVDINSALRSADEAINKAIEDEKRK